MRSIRFKIVYMLCCVMLGVSIGSGPANAAPMEVSCLPLSGSATISGKVVSAGTVPLANTYVKLYTEQGRSVGTKVTANDGSYLFQSVVAGKYYVVVEGTQGFADTWYPSTTDPFASVPVSVTTGTATTNININVVPGGFITGVVRDANGAPLSRAQIMVYDTNKQYMTYAYTLDDGTYETIKGLPSGSYRVAVALEGWLSRYYPSAPNFETAGEVSVFSGVETANINVTLAKGGSISGKVINATTGVGINQVYIYAIPLDTTGTYISKYTDQDGKYSFSGLSSGNYRIYASPGGNLLDQSSSVITVTESTPITNVDLALMVGGSITGKVTTADGTPLSEVYVEAVHTNEADYGYAQTDAAGFYSIQGLPSGDYVVSFEKQDRMTTYYPEARRMQDAKPISVTAQEVVSGINAKLAPGGRISGKVTDATTGEGINEIAVGVYDSEHNYITFATTKPDGTYTTDSELADGTYYVYVSAIESSSCQYVAKYYLNTRDEDEATAVTIQGANTTPNINVQLQRGSFISGEVTDALTNKPIIQGAVEVFDQNGDFVAWGGFTFLGRFRTTTALPSGTYYVYFNDYGNYIGEFYNDQYTLENATPVVLSAPNDLHNIDAQLTLGATFSGTVRTGDTNQPFGAGEVVVFSPEGKELAATWIDENGKYALNDGLPSGQYVVGVRPYNGNEPSVEAVIATTEPQSMRHRTWYDGGRFMTNQPTMQTVSATEPQPTRYRTTYYGGRLTPDQSTKVTLTGQIHLNNIDFVMQQGMWLPLIGRR